MLGPRFFIFISEVLRQVWILAFHYRLSQEDKETLEKYFPYYSNLKPAHQKEFRHKLQLILTQKRFFARGGLDRVSAEMKVLIGATIVQVTFGYRNVWLKHFNKILIYPNTYFSRSLFAGSHNAVIFSVLRREVDGGATYDDARAAVAKTHPEVFDQIKVIAYTQDIPNDTVCIRKEIDPVLKEKISEGLKSISLSKKGSSVLKKVYGISGLMDFDAFFDPVRKARRLLNGDFETLK